MRAGTGLQVEHEARSTGSRNADHHAVVGLPFFLVQDGVAVVGNTLDDAGLAGAARSFAAGGQHSNAGFVHHVEDGSFRWNVESESTLLEEHLERFGQYG